MVEGRKYGIPPFFNPKKYVAFDGHEGYVFGELWCMGMFSGDFRSGHLIISSVVWSKKELEATMDMRLYEFIFEFEEGCRFPGSWMIYVWWIVMHRNFSGDFKSGHLMKSAESWL